ncbi:odorant receptor 131-2-like [Dendropsophus ebraccatus]|uniref:odorant receptor 131-2-like n=1 Tax=Dendropsophus ebraccatus TaxID=150705 RepID=UPI0038310606
MNSTKLNTTMMAQVNKMTEIIRMTMSVLMFLLFGIFIYFMVIILKVFFMTSHVRETPRHILFIHMLLNDVVYLLISFILFLCAIYFISMPVPFCHIIISFSTCSFRITPYNLAVMSLERYVAICHPLRHAELWTVRRATLAIANMWTLGMIPQLLDFIALCSSVNKSFFNVNVICDKRSLTVGASQMVLQTISSVFSFSMVGLVIAFTYVKVLLVARRMDSDKFASKAGKTVLLHAFQLLLSMLSFTSTLTEKEFTSRFVYLPLTNFFLFMCFPRFISPLIYGIRDEVFGKPMRRFFPAVRNRGITRIHRAT